MSSVGVGGEWKAILPGSAVGAGGEWKDIEGMWVGAGGAWKEFFSLGTVTVTGGETIKHSTGVILPASGGLIVNTDCTIDKSEGGTITQLSADTDWVRPVTANPGFYQAMLTVVSGASPTTGDEVGEWLSLSQNRSWFTSVTSGTADGVWRLHIRLASGGSALDTGDFTIDLASS